MIWPVSSLRGANNVQQELYAAIARDGGAHNMMDRMQTRAELYEMIGLQNYEVLDASIVQTIVPEAYRNGHKSRMLLGRFVVEGLRKRAVNVGPPKAGLIDPPRGGLFSSL